MKRNTNWTRREDSVEFSWNFMIRFLLPHHHFFAFTRWRHIIPSLSSSTDRSLDANFFFHKNVLFYQRWLFFYFFQNSEWKNIKQFQPLSTWASRCSHIMVGVHYMIISTNRKKNSYICFDEEGKVNRTVLFNDSIWVFFSIVVIVVEMVDWSVGTFSFFSLLFLVVLRFPPGHSVFFYFRFFFLFQL